MIPDITQASQIAGIKSAPVFTTCQLRSINGGGTGSVFVAAQQPGRVVIDLQLERGIEIIRAATAQGRW